jgi:L-arabinokinase
MGLYPLEGAPANYRYLKKDLSFRYADLNASCDLVIGKLGYGLVAECLASARPILFLGRKDFAEFSLLKGLVEGRGMGLEISLERFRKVDFGEELEALSAQPLEPLQATGVADILGKIGFPG